MNEIIKLSDSESEYFEDFKTDISSYTNAAHLYVTLALTLENVFGSFCEWASEGCGINPICASADDYALLMDLLSMADRIASRIGGHDLERAAIHFATNRFATDELGQLFTLCSNSTKRLDEDEGGE